GLHGAYGVGGGAHLVDADGPGAGVRGERRDGGGGRVAFPRGGLRALGHPVLVAASRKRFLGRVLAGPEGEPPPARERDAATAAVSALAAHAGAWAVRVHEVRATADAVRVVQAIEEARGGAAGREGAR
ncbi:dihydropteroate synthase, partial [Streptomyces viridochromogenes]|uniref:dihydropteroate synthase n=1 Tax=Streptomyces viridochromogenes TaxID=1938 RepID=UPI00211B3EFE